MVDYDDDDDDEYSGRVRLGGKGWMQRYPGCKGILCAKGILSRKGILGGRVSWVAPG